MNVLKKKITKTYEGTKITADYLMLLTSGMMILLMFFMIGEGLIYGAIAVLMIAVLPYAHELAHYFMAKREGLEVSEMSFVGEGQETKVEGTLTHRQTRDIAIAGELITGLVFCIAGVAIFAWGWQEQSIFALFSALVPCVWIISWLHPESDMLIALKANHFLKKQEEVPDYLVKSD